MQTRFKPSSMMIGFAAMFGGLVIGMIGLSPDMALPMLLTGGVMTLTMPKPRPASVMAVIA